MAKYIELAGIPGIGKTTTCNYLRKRFGKHLNFFHSDDITLAISGREFIRKKFCVRINSLIKGKKPAALKTNYHLLKFVDSNCELNNRFWQATISNQKIVNQDRRFITSQYTAKVFEKIQQIKDVESSKTFVVDEGLIHCINNFIFNVSDVTYEQQLHDVLEIMNLPNGVVFFGGDVNIAVERTRKRKFIREKDKFLSKSELLEIRTISMKRKESCMDILLQKNVPVLFLDAKESLELKADKIYSFVHNIS